MTTKLEAISHAETARRLQLKNLVSRQKEFESGVATNKRKKLHGSGRKTLSVELEERMLAWIHNLRLQ